MIALDMDAGAMVAASLRYDLSVVGQAMREFARIAEQRPPTEADAEDISDDAVAACFLDFVSAIYRECGAQ